MREFITIRQKAFFEFLNDYNKDKPKEQQIKLNYDDLVVFDYIYQLCNTNNEKIKQNRILVENLEYTHIAYRKIMKDNPFLNITSKRQLYRIIDKLQKAGFINKYFAKEKGNKTYFTLGHTGLNLRTKMSEDFGQKRLKTKMSDNRKLNIVNSNIKNKIEKYIYTALTFYEKKLLILLGNLQKHFETYSLKVNTYKKHLEVFRGLSAKYEEVELITAIYARAIKAIRENSSSQLKTIANPNFLKASMEDLLIEAKEFMEYENLDEESIETEFYLTFDEDAYFKLLDFDERHSGYFTDKGNNIIPFEDLEENIFLMKEYLKQFDIELASNIKSFLLSHSIGNIPYEILTGRFIYALLDDEYKNNFSSTDELADLYNNILKDKEINYSDLKLQLMEKISIK